VKVEWIKPSAVKNKKSIRNLYFMKFETPKQSPGPKKVSLSKSQARRLIIARQKYIDELERRKMSRSDDTEQNQAQQSERQ
jgi:hypothetical protein